MRDPYRIPFLAVLLIVLLRLSIGWQFLYEGLWKLEAMSTTTPWSASGYLSNAQGPFRDQYRDMTGNPDELNWLDYDLMSKKWDRWAARFKSHYKLSDAQSKKLDSLIDGPEKRTSNRFELPPGISFAKTTFSYDKKTQILSFPTWEPPTPTDFARIFAQLPSDSTKTTPVEQEFHKQLERLRDLSIRLSYRQQLAGRLKGDPGVTGVVFIVEEESNKGAFEMRPAR